MSIALRALRSIPRHRAVQAAPLLAFIVSACGGGGDGPAAPPATGAIRVTSIATAAVDNPSFTYGFSVDNGTPVTLSNTASGLAVIAGLPAGAHTVAVRDLPASCTPDNSSRSVTIRGGDTVTAAFAISCVRTTGDLTVTTLTTGVELDTDGYSILVNSVSRGTVGTNGNLSVRNLAPATYAVEIGGIASNCTAAQVNKPAIITVNNTASVQFEIVCRPRTGSIRFTGTTTGADQDANGYSVYVDQLSNGQRIPANGVLRVLNVTAGVRTISVGDQGGNCAMLVPGDFQVTVVANDTIAVPITVHCAPIGGGVLGFTTQDAANDTLPNTTGNSARAIDVRSVSGRYTADFMMLTFKFAGVVVPATRLAANSLSGIIEFDADENPLSGARSVLTSFGGSATHGIETAIQFDFDSTSASLLGIGRTLGRVGLQYLGDSLVVTVPLSLLADDGNLTFASLFGTIDRPTDLLPNTGQLFARRLGAPIVGTRDGQPAGASRQTVGPTLVSPERLLRQAPWPALRRR